MNCLLMARLHLQFKADDSCKRQAAPRPLPRYGLPNPAKTVELPFGRQGFRQTTKRKHGGHTTIPRAIDQPP